MNLLALIAFVVIEISFIAFTVLIARSGLRNVTNRSFLYFLIAFALWAAANYVSNFTFLANEPLLLLNRVLFFVSIVGLCVLLLFITRVSHQKPSMTARVFVALAAIIGAITSFLPWTVADVYADRMIVGIDFGVSAIVYFAAVIYISSTIIARLLAGTRQRSVVERGRSRVLFVSVGISMFMILITNVLLPYWFDNFSLSLIGIFAGMFIIGGVSYGIVRHGMFDIKRAAIRSVTYSLVLITLSLVYFVLASLVSRLFDNALISTGQAMSGVVISLTLALIFQPVRRFFDRVTNRIFYKDVYNTNEFFTELNSTLVSTTQLKKMVERTSILIARTLKSEQVFFFIRTQEGRHIQAGTEGHVLMPAVDARELSQHFQ